MLERIEQLEENIAHLKKMQEQISVDDIANNKFDEWSLRYGIFESIQIVIDLACHLSSKYNLGTAKTYTACIENLQKEKFLTATLAKSLISAIGLRNLLIHEYVKVDTKQLYSFLELREDFSRFIEEIRESL
ncbi:MAG: DUF86 domain-containing protein [Epsilonproteobacteria bacterium]|nr:DUF86 domain-containing protein [Campylobacterota bacterium]